MEQKSNNDHHPGRWHRWVGGQGNSHPARCSSVSCHIQPPPQLLLLLLLRPHGLTKLGKNWSAHAIQVLAIFCRPIHLSVHDSPSGLRSRRAFDRGCRRKLIRIKVWCGTMSWASARRAAFGAVRAPCVSAPQTSTQSSDQGDGTARRISMRGAAWLAPGQTERLLGMLKFVQWGNSCSGACVTDSTLCVLYVTRESQL